MPIPLGPILGAAGNIFGNILNNRSIRDQNKKSREYADRTYAKQRKDALSDWERQNAYNDPSAQMARLKNAGLNPILAATGGNTGNAGAVTQTTQQGAQFNPSNYDKMAQSISIFDKIYDLGIKKQTVDNLKADNTVKLNEAILKQAMVELTMEQATSTQYDNTAKKRRNTARAADFHKLEVDQLRQQVKKQLLDNERSGIELEFFKNIPAGLGGDLLRTILSGLLK